MGAAIISGSYMSPVLDAGKDVLDFVALAIEGFVMVIEDLAV